MPVTAGKAGTPTALPRATLTALIAEVSLVIAEQPWPFFEHTDLLDFPGARSRLKLTELPPEPPNERERADARAASCAARSPICSSATPTSSS